MASPIVRGQNFGTTELVNATKLQNIVDNSTFKANNGSTQAFNVSGSTDIGTCVKDGGLQVHTTGQLQVEDLKITTGKVANNAITLAKMATQADQTVLANVSGGTAVPTAVPIVDNAGILINDDALGTSDTKGATQGNIKAYIDKLKPNIVQAVRRGTESTSSSTFAPITGMSVSITPKFTNSKFKVSFSVSVSSSNSNYGPMFKLQRNGTDLSNFLNSTTTNRIPTTITTNFPYANSSIGVHSFVALDDTSYSNLNEIIFELDWAIISGTGYLNRSNTDSNNSSYSRSVSQIMVEEIYQ